MDHSVPTGLISPYPTEQLPEGFVYPNLFLKLIKKNPCDHYYPWLFIDPDWPSMKNIRGKIRKWYKKSVIPFASLELGDGDLACFDADDKSGDPEIVMIIFDGSNRKYGYRNFDHWLEDARKTAGKD